MLKKVIWALVLAGILGVVIVYFMKPGSLVLSDNVLTKKADKTKEEGKKADAGENGSKAGGESNPLEAAGKDRVVTRHGSIPLKDVKRDNGKIPEENIVDMSESIVTEGLEYKVNSYRVTKEKGDFNIDPDMKWPQEEQVDENGNMTGDYSYIIINVTIRNVSDSPTDLYLRTLYNQIRDQNGKSKYKVTDGMGLMNTLRAFTGRDPSKGHTSATFHLEPGEVYEGDLAYTETDEMLKDSKLEFVAGPDGAQDYNLNTICIKLN